MLEHVNFFNHAGFLLATVGRMAESAWGSFVRSEGLTTAEFTVLAVLERGPKIQKDLARAAGVDRRNMVATVARLAAAALISERHGAGDRRTKSLALTPKGQARMTAVEQALVSRRAAFFGALNNAERNQLTRLLRKLRDAADKAESS